MKKNKLLNIALISTFIVATTVPTTLFLSSCSFDEISEVQDNNYFDSLDQEKAAKWFYQYDKYNENFEYKYVTPPIYNVDYNNSEIKKNFDDDGWMLMNDNVTFEDFFINKKVADFFKSIAGGANTFTVDAINEMSNYFNKTGIDHTLFFGSNSPGEFGIYYYDIQKENSIRIFANPYFCNWLKNSNIKKIDLSYNDLRYFPNMALAGASEKKPELEPKILPIDDANGFEWINLEHNKLAYLDFNMAHLLKLDGIAKIYGQLQIDYNYMPYIYHQGSDGTIPYRSTYQYFDEKNSKFIGKRVKYSFFNKEGIVESLVAEALKIGLFQKDGNLINKYDFYNYIQSLNGNIANSKIVPSEILKNDTSEMMNYINENFLTSQFLVAKWTDPGTMYPELKDTFKINMNFNSFPDNYSGECLYTFTCNGIFKTDYNFASINANITSETTVAEILDIVRQDYSLGYCYVKKITGFRATKFLPIILICIFGSIILGICGFLSYEFIYLKAKNKKRIEEFNKKEREKK